MAVDTAVRNDCAFCMFVRLAWRCELFRFLVNKRASPPVFLLFPNRRSLLSFFVPSLSSSSFSSPFFPRLIHVIQARRIIFPQLSPGNCAAVVDNAVAVFRVGPRTSSVVDRLLYESESSEGKNAMPYRIFFALSRYPQEQDSRPFI